MAVSARSNQNPEVLSPPGPQGGRARRGGIDREGELVRVRPAALVHSQGQHRPKQVTCELPSQALGPPRRQSSRRPERPEVRAAGAGGGITSGLLWRGGHLGLEGEWAPGGSGDGWPPPPRDLDPGLGGRGWSPQSGEEASAGWRRTGPWRRPCLSAGAAPRARTPRDGNRQAHFADGKLRLRSPRSEVRGQRVRAPDSAGQAALCRQRPPVAPRPRHRLRAGKRARRKVAPGPAAGTLRSLPVSPRVPRGSQAWAEPAPPQRSRRTYGHFRDLGVEDLHPDLVAAAPLVPATLPVVRGEAAEG